MPRALFVGCAFALLSVCGQAQELGWSDCKSFQECQSYVRSWQAWADENLPKCKTAMEDAKNSIRRTANCGPKERSCARRMSGQDMRRCG